MDEAALCHILTLSGHQQVGAASEVFGGTLMSLMERRLILLRHGHTDGNNDGQDRPLSGWHDTPLSALGWRETVALAARLGRELPANTPIFSSPLQRCRKMAEAISSVSGGAVEIEPDLREISCGELEGLSIGEVQRRYPDLWAANLRQDNDYFRWPGGESYAEFRTRCLECLARLRRNSADPLIVVSHAGVISQVLGSLSGTPSSRWSAHRPGNASITEMCDDGQALRLVRFDDCHAPAA